MNSIELANKIRIHVVNMAHYSKESHVASALSIADIIAVLYSDILQVDKNNDKDIHRDRFVLSKGHACAAVYAALAEKDFFDISELYKQCQNGALLSGHISHKYIPGVEVSTGSLGHGCCMAAGMALAGKCKSENYYVYSLMGDGECDEGSVWEMAQFASQQKLSNYIVIIDKNQMQAMGRCQKILDNANLAKRWGNFGWKASEIDGHNHDEIRRAILCAKKSVDQPVCIVADTIKGKGVSFMENNLLWHYRDPQGVDYENAIKELESIS